MDEQPSHIISEQVFGSSKKIQFIGLSPLDSLLSAIESAHRVQLPDPRRAAVIKEIQHQQRTMSIESLLDSNGQHMRHRTSFESSKRRCSTLGDEQQQQQRFTKMRRFEEKSNPITSAQRMTTISCLHAAVAQKSYGSEKRFLCPPPLVSVETSGVDNNDDDAPAPLVSMAVVCENGERPLEQKLILDEDRRGSFKYLHVTGTAKTKQFHLQVSLSHNQATTPSSPTCSSKSPPPPLTQQQQQPYITFFSCPISIISKPSKKTSKARNVSSCIVANSPVSLFNRINSQTVRTKYMTTESGRLCAKNSTWTPFEIIVVRQHDNVPVTYGSEVILKDPQSGVSSPPMVIRKVDKGCISASACGPVSQMQKIALQLVEDGTEPPRYLSARTTADNKQQQQDNAATWLDFQPSRIMSDKPGQESTERLDDYLCWTIVGIAKFRYTFMEPSSPFSTATTTTSSSSSPSLDRRNIYQPSPPPSPPPRRIIPLPMVSAVYYHSHSHCIELIGQHLVQATVTPSRLYEFYLGSHGPLTVKEQHQDVRLVLELPPTQDLLVANHDMLIMRPDGSRYLELPLLLRRQDGATHPSHKALGCEILPDCNAGRWSVVHSSSSP